MGKQTVDRLAISMNNVSHFYNIDSKKQVILNNIDLQIDRGQFVSIIGKSGSGKSTLLGIMNGIISPTSGNVVVCGQPLSNMTDKQRSIFRAKTISIIMQNNNLVSNFDVTQNIILPLLVVGSSVDKARLQEVIRIVGLESHSLHDVSKLSGGQRQRVAIARALIAEPSIIFADEPTGSLDNQSSNEIMELFQNINRTMNTTIVQVTHSMECAAFGNRTIRVGGANIEEVSMNNAHLDEHGKQ